MHRAPIQLREATAVAGQHRALEIERLDHGVRGQALFGRAHHGRGVALALVTRAARSCREPARADDHDRHQRAERDRQPPFDREQQAHADEDGQQAGPRERELCGDRALNAVEIGAEPRQQVAARPATVIAHRQRLQPPEPGDPDIVGRQTRRRAPPCTRRRSCRPRRSESVPRGPARRPRRAPCPVRRSRR